MSERRAAATLEGTLVWLGWSPGADFVTIAADRLDLTYEGIPGDLHSGLYRTSGAREPWYPRGTPMRNERQLSILSEDELAEVAHAMNVPQAAASSTKILSEPVPSSPSASKNMVSTMATPQHRIQRRMHAARDGRMRRLWR